jgi:hypothetical protein
VFGEGKKLLDLSDARGARSFNPGLQAFVKGYRHALVSGAARKSGEDVVDGRKVMWLTFKFNGIGERVAVDESTFRPKLIQPLRPNGKPTTPVWRVETIETTVADASIFSAAPRPPALPTHTELQQGLTVPPPKAAKLLGWRPAWLGTSFRRQRLEWSQIETFSEGSGSSQDRLNRPGQGFDIGYGRGAGRIQVQESREPTLAYGYANGVLALVAVPWPVRGEAAIVLRHTPGRARASECRTYLRWRGLWLTIVARSSAVCLAAARSMTPIGR